MLKVIKLILIIFFITKIAPIAYAIVDPHSSPNNKFGVHILFPSELDKASSLVNSTGGDWGYVTIPIQAHDRNLDKWQKFMDDAKRLHVIPILRIASENYYFDTKVWRKPSYFDIIDFANFLNSLNWPTKNKYIVVYNEVNRSDEWQGATNPSEYAQILNYAVDAFKSLDDDFFIISSGLDNASANVAGTSINQYDFMIGMNDEVPGIFGKIDGLGSHSYPNPAFSQPPWIATSKSITSYRFEANLAERLSGKKLPIFITETGWSREAISDKLIGSYIKQAFINVWSDDSIIAVTPFLLHAGSGPYEAFSLINQHGAPAPSYLAIQDLPKIKGSPVLEDDLEKTSSSTTNLPLDKTFKSIENNKENLTDIFGIKTGKEFLKWLLGVINML